MTTRAALSSSGLQRCQDLSLRVCINFVQINDFANWIANIDFVRNPDIPQTAVAVFRNFVNETTIFGILMTLIARAFVEFIFWICAVLWRVANPREDEDGFKRRSFDPSEDVPPTYSRN